MNKLQESLKATIDQADVLLGKIEANEATPEEKEQFKALNARAKELAETIDAAKAYSDVKNWSDQSDGQAVVPATFDRLALNEEGAIKGVTADPKTGEMHVLEGFDSKEGQKNLEVLKSGAYKDYFVQRLRAQANPRIANDWQRHIKGDAMKILSEQSFTAGEAWIPPDFRANLIQRMATMTSVRNNATVLTTGRDIITFPQAVYTTDDNYTSGIRGTWQGSGAQTSDPAEATNPVAGQVKVPVFLLTANIIVTREQIEDNSFDLLGYINKLGAEAFALTEEEAFTDGNGVSRPFGFTVHPTASIAQGSTSAVNGVTYTGGEIFTGSSGALAWGSGATATATGIMGLEGVLPPQYENGAKWYAQKRTYSGVRSLNVGTSNQPIWFSDDQYPNARNGYNAQLLGYPVVKNQFMDSISTATSSQTPCMALGDLGGYYIADRVGFSVEVNPWLYQARDQVLIYLRKRVGGQLVEYWKMKFLVPTA